MKGTVKRRQFLTGMAALYAMPGLMAAPVQRKVAKSVIEIWVWGGPSHLETFDPKPQAPVDYANGLKAIPTNVDGIFISEWLPKLAKQADKYSIIRSMTHPHNGHETATYLMQTGREPGGGKVFPAIGAVMAMFKSKEYTGDLSPYIILTVPKGRFSEMGFLSEKYAPLVTGGNPNAVKFIVDGVIPPGDLTPTEMQKRFERGAAFDTFGRAFTNNAMARTYDQSSETARRIIFGDAAAAFDLSQESPAMRDRYGRNPFAQSCLVARRLVQRGVPYITLNAQGWDSHKKHFETMQQRTAEMDQAFAALLEDLSGQGLLDTTLVWWTGEFGRTPKVSWEPPWNGGRHHYGRVFTVLVAGGGFKGGRVIGSSDEKGENVKERPVYPSDLLGSMYLLAGIDATAKLPHPWGLDAYVLDTQNEGMKSAGMLEEIL